MVEPEADAERRSRAVGHRDCIDYGWRESMLRSSTLSRIALLVILGVSLGGCEVAGGIFKAGIWVGALVVFVIVVLLIISVKKIKG